jgi:hypothetical protein
MVKVFDAASELDVLPEEQPAMRSASVTAAAPITTLFLVEWRGTTRGLQEEKLVGIAYQGNLYRGEGRPDIAPNGRPA